MHNFHIPLDNLYKMMSLQGEAEKEQTRSNNKKQSLYLELKFSKLTHSIPTA